MNVKIKTHISCFNLYALRYCIRTVICIRLRHGPMKESRHTSYSLMIRNISLRCRRVVCVHLLLCPSGSAGAVWFIL